MATNNPVTTILQIGDILRFDGLATRGEPRDHNRRMGWLRLDGVDTAGLVTLVFEFVEGAPQAASMETTLPYDRLAKMVDDGAYQIVEKVGD